MNEELAEMLIVAEADGVESIEEVLREARFVDVNREKCVKASRDMYRFASEIHKFRGSDDREECVGDGRSESMDKVACELQQKSVGTNVQGATRVHVSEACEGRWPSSIDNHAMRSRRL